MVKVTCEFCGKVIERYLNKKRNKQNVYCSKACKYSYQKKSFIGNKNPNYKERDKKRKCVCGNEKDHRAKFCAICSKKSHSINSILTEESDKRILEQILGVLKESYSFLEISKKINVSRFIVTKIIKKNNINTSHFKACAYRPSSLESLTVGTYRKNATIRRIVLKEKLLDYKCNKCGLGTKWHNENLLLELDHINGNSMDNRIENLRFLCPNCHSQTETNKGKNVKPKERK